MLLDQPMPIGILYSGDNNAVEKKWDVVVGPYFGNGPCGEVVAGGVGHGARSTPGGGGGGGRRLK
jgi:hypothetical protein